MKSKSFRSDIINQINAIPYGKIFDIDNLAFDISKSVNTSVVLSELYKRQDIERLGRGVYYRQEKSILGLGNIPIGENEIIQYIAKKVNGYETGLSMYNQMQLTEQVPMIVTIAVPKLDNTTRCSNFNLRLKFVKAYVIPKNQTETYLLRILDSIKDSKNIPATNQQTVLQRINNYHIKKLKEKNIDTNNFIEFAKCYPPRVRKILGELLLKNEEQKLAKSLLKTINPNTNFNFIV
jgi:hypothetical protein